MITSADALAYCLSTGTAQADCQAAVNDHMANGAYCDGDVSIVVDPSGNRVTTCIPSGVIARKIAAQKGSPLPASMQQPQTTTAAIGWIAAGVVALGVVGWFALRGDPMNRWMNNPQL